MIGHSLVQFHLGSAVALIGSSDIRNRRYRGPALNTLCCVLDWSIINHLLLVTGLVHCMRKYTLIRFVTLF